ncbi:MAG: FAD-binding oxidoreductase [Parasphingorhabdus sp.]
MATKVQLSPTELIAQSGAQVLSDTETLDFYAHDIYSRGADLLAVVRPSSKEELAAAVRAATSQGLTVIPRGGGMSYTSGYTAEKPGCVLFDLAAMNRILDINEIDMTVTVEAGCTWAQLHEALSPKGLRTPFWGTLSGKKATVGGGMSQNGIFWGTCRYGTAVQSCISMEVVLADGNVMQTGSKFARPYGPDLTGLFLADTGALAMKATITLRLIPEAKTHGYASFTFASHNALLKASSDIERASIATECFGFDPKLNAIRMKRDSLASDTKQLVGMMKKQGSVFKALKEGAKVISAGRDFMEKATYSLHVLAEGRIQSAVDADIEEARQIVSKHGGAETENTIPKIIRANPFGPLNGVLGPDGERWAPVHGLLPHSRAKDCYEAILALFDKHREKMDEMGLHEGTLIAAVGGSGIIIEPCIYWPDARNPVIEDTIESSHIAKLPVLDANGEAWKFAQQIKQELVSLFYHHGAVHFQIGRTYRHNDSLDDRARILLDGIKTNVDPQHLMNSGSLGL